MAILEKVMQMKNQGISDDQIVSSLTEKGVSPREIYEALSQSNVKNSLNQESYESQASGEYPDQQSIMSHEETDISLPENNQQMPSYQPSTAPYEGETAGEAYQEYYPQYQQGYAEYQPQQSLDLETVNDIAEQIFEEKVLELKKQISQFTKFKEETSLTLDLINQRLDKMETSFNELQMAIIRKIGSYGEDIKNISAEMHETQKSFSKVIDPLTENIRMLQEISGKPPSSNIKTSQHSTQASSEPRQKSEKKTKDTFENYLR